MSNRRKVMGQREALSWITLSDDLDCRPRHNRNPSTPERVMDRMILVFAFIVGGLNIYGYSVFAWGVFLPLLP